VKYSTGADVVELIAAISQRIDAHKEALNRLDAALGDGDHGTGISAGFCAAAKQVRALEKPTPADVFQTTAVALMNTMGGSSGALYGTFFLKAGLLVKGKHALQAQDWADLFQAGLDGVVQRGKAKVGGKTMVDALAPAVSALKKSVQTGHTLCEALQRAADAAQSGAKATADMAARFGRAKFTGERALGHQDAGAVSVSLMFQALALC